MSHRLQISTRAARSRIILISKFFWGREKQHDDEVRWKSSSQTLDMSEVDDADWLLDVSSESTCNGNQWCIVVIINRKPEIFESHYYHQFPLVLCLILVVWFRLCVSLLTFFFIFELFRQSRNNNFQVFYSIRNQHTHTRKQIIMFFQLFIRDIVFFFSNKCDIEKWKQRREPPVAG